MYLRKLSLFNYKNYNSDNFVFSEGLNCILGRNASGKTNLLDSIYTLALTKSAFNNIDSDNVSYGERSFIIKGFFISKEERDYEIICAYENGKKKVIRADGKEYQRLSDHIGKVPVVLVVPDDVDIIRSGGEERRKFFDSCLGQTDSEYLDNLIHYKKLIKNRNAILKQAKDSGLKPDEQLLEYYDKDLIRLNREIYNKRLKQLEVFLPVFQSFLTYITDSYDQVLIRYKSMFNGSNFKELYIRSKNDDINVGRTLVGIHKDDYDIIFKDNEKTVKGSGSQGQKKSVTLSLKMAQAELLHNDLKIKPIILLDDIFDRLDEVRIEKLLKKVTESFRQVILTDARENRTREFLSTRNYRANFIHIETP